MTTGEILDLASWIIGTVLLSIALGPMIGIGCGCLAFWVKNSNG